jgi:hypothetical protein
LLLDEKIAILAMKSGPGLEVMTEVEPADHFLEPPDSPLAGFGAMAFAVALADSGRA